MPSQSRCRTRGSGDRTLDAQEIAALHREGLQIILARQEGAARWVRTVYRREGTFLETLAGLRHRLKDASQAPPSSDARALLDERQRALQTMRSFTNVMPGESRGCLGCHESHSRAPMPDETGLALRAPPRTITPPPWDDRTVSYPRYVQPVLDRYCGRCHQGDGEATRVADLTEVTKSYSHHLEGLGRVRDASDAKQRIVPGYVLFAAYVRAGRWQFFPLESQKNERAMCLHPAGVCPDGFLTFLTGWPRKSAVFSIQNPKSSPMAPSTLGRLQSHG